MSVTISQFINAHAIELMALKWEAGGSKYERYQNGHAL